MSIRIHCYRAALIALAITAGVAGTVRAQAAGGMADPLTDARFYTGSAGTQGVFPGKLVCLRCDLHPSDAAKAQCGKAGHQYALEIDGDPTIHPLLPGDAAALKQLNAARHGAQVSVTGMLFPNLGTILVSSMASK